MVPPASDRIPPVPPYSGSCYAPRHFRIRGCHALRRAFPDPSTNVSDTTSQSYNPADAVTPAVWALPRSLATTCGIIVIFSSSGYLDVSVPRVCPHAVGSHRNGWVVPFGNPRIKGYLHLPGAYRSLSRPSSPLRARASPVRS